MHDVARDQKPVLLLGGQDAIENAVDALLQPAVFAMLQTVQRAFQGLVKVRIEGVVAAERAVELARRLVEIGHVPVRFEAIERMGDGHLVMRLLPRAPEPAAQLHPVVGHFLQALDRRLIGPGGAAQPRSRQ